MRKLFAVLLAMLMLLGTAALAEQKAAVMVVDHMQLENMGQRVEVKDMGAYLALQNVGDLPAVALRIDGGGAPLFTAVGQLDTSRFNFAVAGMDKGYTAEIPAEQMAGLSALGKGGMAMLIPSLLPLLDQMALPGLSSVNIPKVDLSGVLAAYSTGNGTFEIPVEQSARLLDQALEIARAQGKNLAQLDKATQMLEDLKKKGTGIAIRGTIEDRGATQKVVAGIHMAYNGKVDNGQTARITLESRQNSTEVALAVVKFGIPFTVANASLNANPARAQASFDLSVIGGTYININAGVEGGMNKITFTGSVGSSYGTAEVAYGQQGGSDVLSFYCLIGGVDMSFVITTARGADGARTGDMVLNVADGLSDIVVRGDLTLYTGDAVDLGGFAMPAALSPISDMTKADTDAIGKAFAPVTDYVNANLALN